MNFEGLEILETYLYYDGALIFKVELDGEIYLAYSWDYEKDSKRYSFIYFQTSLRLLERLKKNQIPIRAFFKESCFVFSAYKVWYEGGKQISYREVEFSEIEHHSPKPNVFLEPESEDVG